MKQERFSLSAHLCLPLTLVLICMSIAGCDVRKTASIRVDITPLVDLQLPPTANIPAYDESQIRLGHAHTVDGHGDGRIDIAMWHDADIADTDTTLDCRGDQLIVIEQSDGRHYYCEGTDTDEFGDPIQFIPTRIYDYDFTVQKGNLLVRITTRTDPYPDGGAETRAVKLLADLWQERIEAGVYEDGIDKGRILFEFHCTACHSTDGTPGTGPTLLDMYGRTVQLADGTTTVADEEYIRTSVIDPTAQIVAGYEAVYRSIPDNQPVITTTVMPQIYPAYTAYYTVEPYPHLDELVKYVMSLKTSD